jgi:hypothetical protein
VKIWKQEKIPSEWTEGILCPVYKKGIVDDVITTEGYPY